MSVIEANISLLLGLDYQAEWGMVIDLGMQKVYIRKSKEGFRINKEARIWTLPI